MARRRCCGISGGNAAPPAARERPPSPDRPSAAGGPSNHEIQSFERTRLLQKIIGPQAESPQRYSIAFSRYKILLYNTTDKTVSANLFAYLTN